MDFVIWRDTVYKPTRDKFSATLATELPDDHGRQQREFEILPPMAFKAAELRRSATMYYREAQLVAEVDLVQKGYPKSSLSSLTKPRCGEELAIMEELEGIQDIIRERRFDIKKLLFGFQEKDS